MLGGVSDTYRSGPSGSGVDQAVGMQLAGSPARSYSLLSKGALATHGQDSLSMNKRVQKFIKNPSHALASSIFSAWNDLWREAQAIA